VGQTGRSVDTRYKERMGQLEKFVVAERRFETGQDIDLNKTSILDEATEYVDHMTRSHRDQASPKQLQQGPRFHS
jgi:hypothetical protein